MVRGPHQPEGDRNTKMKAFANLTRQAAKSLFEADSAVYTAVDDAWKAVGLT